MDVYDNFSFLLTAALKSLIGRERPDEVYHLIETSSYALPSGHALKSTVVYLGLYTLVFQLMALSNRQKSMLKLILVLPVSIGISRICLGVHWPSDVIAGWGIGVFISWAFYRAIRSVKYSITAFEPI